MNISQALKEKNRILNQIKKIKERLTKYNQVEVGTKRPYDVKETYNELSKLQEDLVATKTAIHMASNPVREDIFFQSEAKDRLVFLRTLPNKSGMARDPYSRTDGFEVESILGAKEVDDMIEALEAQIDIIQDRLDKFNQQTEVDL